MAIEVSGFLFEDEALAAQAKKEEEGVRFIKEKSALNNPETVLKLYKTVLQQKLFVTPVGMHFLMELQDYLLASNVIPNEEIPAINTEDFMKVVEDDATGSSKETFASGTKKSAGKRKEYKTAFHVASFFAIVFGISVLGMFIIAEVSSDNVTILNYRNKIINEFEQWEQELEEEEDRLKEWEEELSKREAALEEAQ